MNNKQVDTIIADIMSAAQEMHAHQQAISDLANWSSQADNAIVEALAEAEASGVQVWNKQAVMNWLRERGITVNSEQYMQALVVLARIEREKRTGG